MELGTGGKVAIGVGIAVGIAAAIGGIVYAMSRAKPPTVYICPYCPATFDTYEALVDHIESEHSGQEVPSETKFEYINLRCSSPWDPTGDHPIYDIECDIFNCGSIRETRVIQFWVHWDSTGRYSNPHQVEITLDPGDTYHYHYRQGNLVENENCYGFVTDNYFEWEWYDDKRWPHMGDRSSGCNFKGGWR